MEKMRLVGRPPGVTYEDLDAASQMAAQIPGASRGAIAALQVMAFE